MSGPTIGCYLLCICIASQGTLTRSYFPLIYLRPLWRRLERMVLSTSSISSEDFPTWPLCWSAFLVKVSAFFRPKHVGILLVFHLFASLHNL
jgi:TRAP-type C4-dicarboxylate transport system permease small subunit